MMAKSRARNRDVLPRIRRQIGELASRADPKESGLRVYIPLRVYHKMSALTMVADSETSAMGMVHLETNSERVKIGQEIWVDDIHYVHNTSSTAATTLDPADLSKTLIEMIKDGQDTSYMRLWFHTHYNFGVFWSGTDQRTAEETLENSRWTLSIVMNQKHELLARVDIYRPDLVTHHNVPIYLVMDAPKTKWARQCRQAAAKINRAPISEGRLSELSEEFIEQMRSRGLVVDQTDVKKKRGKKKGKQNKLKQIAHPSPKKDEGGIVHHHCVCGVTLEILRSKLEKDPNFSCPKCKQNWVMNNVKALGANQEAEDKTEQKTVDDLYHQAIEEADIVRLTCDKTRLDGMPVNELWLGDEDEEVDDYTTRMREELTTVTSPDYLDADDFVNEMSHLQYLGSYGAMRVYWRDSNRTFACTDDHPTLSLLRCADAIEMSEIDKNPARYMEVDNANSIIMPAHDSEGEFIYYDLISGEYFVAVQGNLGGFGSTDFLETADERVLKNRCGTALQRHSNPRPRAAPSPLEQRYSGVRRRLHGTPSVPLGTPGTGIGFTHQTHAKRPKFNPGLNQLFGSDDYSNFNPLAFSNEHVNWNRDVLSSLDRVRLKLDPQDAMPLED